MTTIHDLYTSILASIKTKYAGDLAAQCSAMGEQDILRLIADKQYDWQLYWSIKKEVLHSYLTYFYHSYSIDYDGIDEYDFVKDYGYSYGDDYYSSDCVRGTWKNMPFESVYIYSTVEDQDDYQDDDGNWHTDYYTRTIFKGEAIQLNVPFFYREYLYIYSGTSKMDHQSFSSTYSISCKDEIYTRYLLTQDFMDRLVQLKEYLGIAPGISFCRYQINVFIPSKPKYPAIDFRQLEEVLWDYCFEVKLLIEVLNILKLEEHSIANDES